MQKMSYVDFDHELSDDELIHFKYKYRKKVGNTWRYWYEDTSSRDFGAHGSRSKLQNLVDTVNTTQGDTNTDYDVNDAYNEYRDSVRNDIRIARKYHNKKRIKQLKAGLTYVKMMVNKKYRNAVLNDAAVRSNAKSGKSYIYKLTRDNKRGGVVVSMNKQKNLYKG